MRNNQCSVCFRKFSKLSLHIAMSRCGRYWNSKLTKHDKEMIEKYGLDKAIRRVRNVS